MKYDYLRTIPVRQRPKMIGVGSWEYFRDWEKVFWFVAISLPALGSAAYNGFALSRWAWAAFGFAVCQVGTFVGFMTFYSGMSSSNSGTYFRKTEPIRYWLDFALCILVYAFGMAGMWVAK